MLIADIMDPAGEILLRPEYGLLSGHWPVIACRNQAVLKSIQAQYTPGRDIIISTGIIDEWTEPHYQSQLLAAVAIESRQDIATRRIVDPAAYAAHVARHGKELWPVASPILCLYHLPLIDAHDIIPEAYAALSYTSGSGRLRGGALTLDDHERAAVMSLPVTRVPVSLHEDVTEFQTMLKRHGLPTYECR
jgi:hypothetical protein